MEFTIIIVCSLRNGHGEDSCREGEDGEEKLHSGCLLQ